jgi:hypothetical protein
MWTGTLGLMAYLWERGNEPLGSKVPNFLTTCFLKWSVELVSHIMNAQYWIQRLFFILTENFAKVGFTCWLLKMVFWRDGVAYDRKISFTFPCLPYVQTRAFSV